MQWLVLAAALAISGCAWDTYDPSFAIPATGATTPQEVCRWVDARVVYLADDIHDRTEYWQSPDQTYEWGRGDCEDYVILVMYLIHRDLGGWPSLVGGYFVDAGHAWVGY
jgi:predicted transglutaminase-like cysteine proteinase